MLFEERCAGCDRPGAVICRTCRFGLLGPSPSGPDGTVSAVAFRGRARDVVLGLKYGNRRPVVKHLAGLLVNRLVGGGLGGRSVDMVTWAPTSGRRRRERGFDQAELIARQVARQLGLPCRRLLRRRDSGQQTGHGRAGRLAGGPRFVARPGLDGRRVLVIDDVVTTGSTLESAADALVASGARHVVRAAVAATPDPTARPRFTEHAGEVIHGPWGNVAGQPARRSA